MCFFKYFNSRENYTQVHLCLFERFVIKSKRQFYFFVTNIYQVMIDCKFQYFWCFKTCFKSIKYISVFIHHYNRVNYTPKIETKTEGQNEKYTLFIKSLYLSRKSLNRYNHFHIFTTDMHTFHSKTSPLIIVHSSKVKQRIFLCAFYNNFWKNNFLFFPISCFTSKNENCQKRFVQKYCPDWI
jgi:hypothetical protein